MPEQDQDFMQAAFGPHGTAAAPPPQQGGPAPAAAPSSPSGSVDPDFLKAAFGGPSQTAPSDDTPGAQATPPEGDDPARMGVGESSFTRPLSTYLGIPEYRQGAGGVERGVEKFASALTSPLNVALLLVTGGLGGLAEAGAASAAEVGATEAGEALATPALSVAGKAGQAVLSKLAPETAQQVVTAAGAIEKLTTLGFTLTQLHDVAQSVPRIGDAIKAGDTDTAMEMITSAALGTVAAGLSAAHLVRGEGKSPTWTNDKEVIAESQRPQRFYRARANQYETDHSEFIKDQNLDSATMLYKEAGGTEGETAPTESNGTLQKLKQWREDVLADKGIKPQWREKWAARLELAQKLPDEAKNISTELTGEYRKYWQEYQDKGIVREALPDGQSNEGRENYAGPHIYDRNDPVLSGLLDRGKQQLVKNPDHLKPREYATAVDALHAGFEPTRGIVAAHAEYIRQFGEKMSHYQAEQALLRETGADHMPLAISPTMLKRVKEVIPEPGEGTGLLTGKSREAVRADSLPQIDLNRIPPERLFQGQDGQLYLDVHDYQDGPDLFTRRRWIGDKRDPNNSAEGLPITEAQPLRIHPDYVEPITTAFQDSSWFRKNPIMRTALGVSSGAKRSLLSLSPFHWTTEYLRGVQMGLSPLEALNPPRITETSRVATSKFAANVLNGSSKAGHEFAEGVATNDSMLSKIPGIGKVLGNIEDKLFGANGYVDRLKSAAFEKVSKQLSERNRNWSTDQADYAAAKITDAAFGGLNYKMMGVSMASTDALRLMFLAPDFTGSQIAFAKYGVQPGGSVVAQSLGRIALYNFGVAQLLNLLVTGKIRPDHPFGVVSPDDKNVWTVRTMPQDMLHAMTDPRGFLYNRLNPVITRTGAELASGRDQEGHVVTQERQVHDLLRNILPIPLQAGLPGYHPEGQTWTTQGLRAIGATAIPNRTTAENTARELAGQHSPSGAVKPEQVERHQLVLDLENKLQNKEITPEILAKQYVQTGKISQKDVADITKNMADTQLMGPADARLYRYASRLPADEFLKVWDVANSSERRDLRPLLVKRYVAYIKEAVPSDPTYQRLKAIFGEPQAAQPAK